MKKKIALFLILCIMVMALCGCSSITTYEEAHSVNNHQFFGNYFTLIRTWNDGNNDYSILYANDTGVKYFLIDGYRSYALTPLYNADGTLQIWEGE